MLSATTDPVICVQAVQARVLTAVNAPVLKGINCKLPSDAKGQSNGGGTVRRMIAVFLFKSPNATSD